MKMKRLLLVFTLLFIFISPLKIFAGEVNSNTGSGEESGNYTFNGTGCNFVNHAAF